MRLSRALPAFVLFACGVRHAAVTLPMITRSHMLSLTWRAALCMALLAWATWASAVSRFAPPSVSRTMPNVPGIGVAVNRSGMEAFVLDAAAGRVAVIDQTSTVTSVPVGPDARYIASGAAARFYVSNAGDNTVSVRPGSKVPVGGSGPIVVGPADSSGTGDTAYLLRADGVVAMIDGRTVTATTFDTGLRAPTAHALNAAGNRLFVTDASGEVRVFDVKAAAPAQAFESFRVPGRPVAVTTGIDPKLYVLSDANGGALTEIDLGANTVRTLLLPGNPQGPATLGGGFGYVLAGFANELVLFSTGTRNVYFMPTGPIRSIEHDNESGLAFALDGSGVLWVVDPRTLHFDRVPVAAGSNAVKFIYKSCNAFVSGPVLTVVNAPCGDLVPGGVNAEALWWVPEGAESGWGLNIAHQGITLFATWFTYDANGQPTWLVMSNGADVGKNRYAGTLYRTTGPPFNAATFDPARVTRTPVGSMDVVVRSVDNASISATVNGATINKDLARQLFSWPVPECDTTLSAGPLPVYQDLWWNPSESGWGLNVAHQGNVLFVTWFTYDTDGSPTWFVGSDLEKTGNATYSGTLYKTFGPPLTASPWDPSKVTRMPVGSATLTFSDDDHGSFAYTVNGISGSKAITRQVFATPVTRCR